MAPWIEYLHMVNGWAARVKKSPDAETYTARWQARLRHPSWQEKRDALLWLCAGRCERCGIMPHPSELQVHHLHYDTLWYESHQDLQLLCPPCHHHADRERADEQAEKHQDLPVEVRARRYMEIANRGSGQPDWPVSYRDAIKRIRRLRGEDAEWDDRDDDYDG